jgi:predicted Zn-dependent peptidase
MDFKIEKKQLDNGLQVLLVPMESVPSVTSFVMVQAGSRWEKEEKAGISHFLEHMVFKGTDKYPSHIELASAVDSVGADFNAFTSKEYTGFYVRAASMHLELSLDVLSEMICYPKLSEKDIDKEKPVIFEEINMREDQPMIKAEEVFETLLYGGRGLGRRVIGSKQTVGSITRDDFVAYRNKWYHPANIVLGLVGDKSRLEEKNILELVKKYFSQDLEAEEVEHENDFQLQQQKKKIIAKDTEQAHLCLGVAALERGNKDRYVQALLTTILGSTFSSRMFLEVREKRGLAYYVRTQPDSYLNTGHLVTRAGTHPDKLVEAVKVIKNEYFKICDDQDNLGKDLKWAKEYLKGKIALQLESTKSVASFFVEDLLIEGKTRTMHQIIKEVDRVTTDDILRLSSDIFKPEALRLAVIGPKSLQEKDFGV